MVVIQSETLPVCYQNTIFYQCQSFTFLNQSLSGVTKATFISLGGTNVLTVATVCYNLFKNAIPHFGKQAIQDILMIAE